VTYHALRRTGAATRRRGTTKYQFFFMGRGKVGG
jgi:hypothetical protein